MKRFLTAMAVPVLALITAPAMAQSDKPMYSELEATLMQWSFQEYALLLLLAMMAVVCLLLFSQAIQLLNFYKKNMHRQGQSLPWVMELFSVFSGDTKLLTGEYKDVVIAHHDYDGIVELDNDLPPWWKWMFYLTIVFGVAYMVYYHVLEEGGALQDAEYVAEVEQAAIKYANVDLEYEKPSAEEAVLAAGKLSYEAKCVACHGLQGQGGVGPNLTDEYWLHGGDVNAVYTSVKYGIVSKGMKSWKEEFSNEEVYAISSYILTSLQGTNPPDGKEPQGDKYVPEK